MGGIDQDVELLGNHDRWHRGDEALVGCGPIRSPVNRNAAQRVSVPPDRDGVEDGAGGPRVIGDFDPDEMAVQGQPIRIGGVPLIRLKRESGRPQDLVDVASLMSVNSEGAE